MSCLEQYWSKRGRLVYGVSQTGLNHILHEEGCECSQMIFEHSPFYPQVTADVLKEESLKILIAYFSKENHK